MSSNVQAVELVFLLLLLFVVAFGALARKLQVAYPIVLVIAGGLLGFVPGIPRIALNPDVIFFVILPPLLYSAAWQTSWREFSYNLVSILLLAFGLVTFTVVGVARERSGTPPTLTGNSAWYWAQSSRPQMPLRQPPSPNVSAFPRESPMFSKARAWSTTPADFWLSSLV